MYQVRSTKYQDTSLVEFMSYYESLLCTWYMVLGTYFLALVSTELNVVCSPLTYKQPLESQLQLKKAN